MILRRINLVPKKALDEQIKALNPYVLCVCMFVAVVIVFSQHQYLGWQLKKVTQNLSVIKKQAAEEELTQARLIRLTAEVKREKKRMQGLQNIVNGLAPRGEGKQHFSGLLLHIAELVPASIIFDKIEFKSGGGLIAGTAMSYDDLPVFIKALKGDPFFKQAVFRDVTKDNTRSDGGLVFNISFELN